MRMPEHSYGLIGLCEKTISQKVHMSKSEYDRNIK